jgi:hypothetical protein
MKDKNGANAIRQAQDAKAMDLAKWRASRLHEMDLPSGLHVIVRDVTMTDLLLTGKLPGSFVDMADDAFQKGAGGLDLKEIVKNGTEFRVMLDALVEIALVVPQIGVTADDGHITLDELPNDDKMAIFNFVNREVTDLRPFREGEAEPVETVQHGDGVRLPPQ